MIKKKDRGRGRKSQRVATPTRLIRNVCGKREPLAWWRSLSRGTLRYASIEPALCRYVERRTQHGNLLFISSVTAYLPRVQYNHYNYCLPLQSNFDNHRPYLLHVRHQFVGSRSFIRLFVSRRVSIVSPNLTSTFAPQFFLHSLSFSLFNSYRLIIFMRVISCNTVSIVTYMLDVSFCFLIGNLRDITVSRISNGM